MLQCHLFGGLLNEFFNKIVSAVARLELRLRQFLEQARVHMLPKPARFPDLSSIEHIWDVIDTRPGSFIPQPSTNLNDLRLHTQDAWNDILQGDIDHFIQCTRRLRIQKSGRYCKKLQYLQIHEFMNGLHSEHVHPHKHTLNYVRPAFAADWKLHIGNASSHTCFVVSSYLIKNGFNDSPSRRSPDLPLPDFFLFTKPRTALKGRCHGTLDAVKAATTRTLPVSGASLGGSSGLKLANFGRQSGVGKISIEHHVTHDVMGPKT
ncbi:hypothetical protein NQ318_019212 [Aromia moschata]|uniref:Uncharacterized protein n=1 Tax=Aromia moschata TaxID=1265417 RepID=A0AAV8YXD4_9CUCU|nr:hypothetical protein NQ318_019212 [Aromia moschata]